MTVDFSINTQFARQGQDAGAPSAGSAMTGAFMGRQAAAVASPMSLLADAAEELTFAVDTTDESELSDRKERKKTSESLIERVQLYQEMMHEAGKARDMDELTRRLRQSGGKDQALREAREHFPDPSDAWAALSGSLDALEKEGADGPVCAGIRAAMDELLAQEGPAIHAGIQGALAAREFDGLGSSDDLRGMYRQTVLEFGTVNDVLAHVLERHGDVGFDKAMDFLFRALGNDLAADTPSMDKTHLESVHANLGQVRLLQSAHTLCDKMLERWENVHGVQGVRDGSLRPMDLLGEIVGLRNERFLGAMHIDRITARAQAPDIEHEVLFLQEMLNMTRSFPSQLFDGDQERMKVLDAVQERVDNAIAREDDFLAAQDEGLTMLDREIAEFGRRMGMPGFALDGGDVAALDVESLGRVYFERGEGELLVYLAFPVPAHDAKAPHRVLELCGYRHAHPMPLCGGVHAGNAVLLTRMDERTVTAAMLENAIVFLGKMQERIA